MPYPSGGLYPHEGLYPGDDNPSGPPQPPPPPDVQAPGFHLFRPPRIKQRPVDPQGERLWLYYGVDVGISVLKRHDGTYYQQQWPTPEEMDAAVITYMGGHEYVVDDNEYLALVSAGYLPGFSDDGTGYGEGSYGSGNYGE